jgi:hypothetical protein
MVARGTIVTALIAVSLFGATACNNMSMTDSKPDGPPTYALVRLRHAESRVEMLTLMETFGAPMCQAALREFTAAVFENPADMEGWKETERDCQEMIKPLYQQIFNDEPVHATYLKITVKEGWEYESRIVLYGIPASQALPACEAIARALQGKLQARAQCVQGTEG